MKKYSNIFNKLVMIIINNCNGIFKFHGRFFLDRSKKPQYIHFF